MERIEIRFACGRLLGEPHLIASEQVAPEERDIVRGEDELRALRVDLGIVKCLDESTREQRVHTGDHLIDEEEEAIAKGDPQRA